MTSNFIFQSNTCGYSPYVTSSLTRGWVCRLQLLRVLASAVILRSKFHRTHFHILLSQIRDSPNLEGQVPVFISPRNRVAQLYSQALGPLLVASYDSQGYSGGIRSRLHTGLCVCLCLSVCLSVKVKIKVTLRLTVSESVSLVGRALWQEDGSLFCICWWSSPAQSFSGMSPLDLATIFYCLSFEISLFVATYDTQGHGGGIRPRLQVKSSYVRTDGFVG
jgi:hypothetical protein